MAADGYKWPMLGTLDVWRFGDLQVEAVTEIKQFYDGYGVSIELVIALGLCQNLSFGQCEKRKAIEL